MAGDVDLPRARHASSVPVKRYAERSLPNQQLEPTCGRLRHQWTSAACDARRLSANVKLLSASGFDASAAAVSIRNLGKGGYRLAASPDASRLVIPVRFRPKCPDLLNFAIDPGSFSIADAHGRGRGQSQSVPVSAHDKRLSNTTLCSSSCFKRRGDPAIVAPYGIDAILRMTMTPTDLSAHALSAAIHARELSCRELMQATLARIDAVNPTHNAIVSLCDGDTLLAEANARDALLARGQSLGWMHGLPQAIKDLANTAGLTTTLGSPLLRDFVPREDALFVQRMKAAGCIVIGKTNTPEFGLGSHTFNEVFGITRNAYDCSKSAGGSERRRGPLRWPHACWQ